MAQPWRLEDEVPGPHDKGLALAFVHKPDPAPEAENKLQPHLPRAKRKGDESGSRGANFAAAVAVISVRCKMVVK